MAISSGEYWPYLLLFPGCHIQAHTLKKKNSFKNAFKYKYLTENQSNEMYELNKLTCTLVTKVNL